MYFTYLNLPVLPENFFSACLEKTNLIGVHPKINALNEYRGIENRATILPQHVNEWLRETIYTKVFDDYKNIKNGLFNVTSYKDHWKNKIYWGMHTKHVDIDRCWALNYYFDTGGENTTIRWHDEDEIIAEVGPIEKNKWCILKTDIFHSVKGIEPGKIRYFISIGFNEFSEELISEFVDAKSMV